MTDAHICTNNTQDHYCRIIPHAQYPNSVLSCPHHWVIILTVKCSGGDNVEQITAHLVSCTSTNGCEYCLFIAHLSLIALLNGAKYIAAYDVRVDLLAWKK